MADFIFSSSDSPAYSLPQYGDFLYDGPRANADTPANLMSILSACSYPTLLPGDAAGTSTSSTSPGAVPDSFAQFGLQFDPQYAASAALEPPQSLPSPARVGRSVTAAAKRPPRRAKGVKKAARPSNASANANAKGHDAEGSDSPDSSREVRTRQTCRPKNGGRSTTANVTQRRRKQIREAQRAYRNRKETRITQLVNRVTQLESTISSMSNVITTFADSLIKSGVLTTRADIASCTYETLETTLNLAKIVEASDLESNQIISARSPRLPDAKPTTTTATTTTTTTIPPSPSVRTELSINYNDYTPRITFATSSASLHGKHIDHATFMDQLHWAVLYNAYVVLTDPSIPTQAVNRRFRLMFTVSTRPRIAAFFAAALHAKLNQKSMADEWRTVPFFPLGGAGTHYAWSASAGRYTRRSRHWQWIPVPIGVFAPDVQEDLGGEWFDMQDLECFLTESGVNFAVEKDVSGQSVDAARLLGCKCSTCHLYLSLGGT